MKRQNMRIWKLLLALPIICSCSALVFTTSTPITTKQKVSATKTNTIIPSQQVDTPTFTQIPTKVDLGKLFAEPLLQSIKDKSPDFDDNFTSSNKRWNWGFGSINSDGVFEIQDGVARFRLNKAQAYMENKALNITDYILQFDANMVSGGRDSILQINIHLIDQNKWLLLNLQTVPQIWHLDKMWMDPGHTLVSGSENVNPIGVANHIVIITLGEKTAIYLNNELIAYIEDIDFDTTGKIMFFCASNTATICEFDNVKQWSLLKVKKY